MSIAPQGWTAGASSSVPLEADGWFSFSVPTGAVGVSVGIGAEDLSTNPAEPTHGFVFGSGIFYVVERGVNLTSAAAFSNESVFSIVRLGEQVLYCHAPAGQYARHADLPFELPGAVVHASATKLPAGPVLLDAALLSAGDRVVDAQCVALYGGATIAFEGLLVAAAEGDDAAAAMEMQALQVDAGSGTAATAVFTPMAVVASDVARSGVAAAMGVMTVDSSGGGTLLRGAYVLSPAMTVMSSGAGMSTDSVDVEMRPLELSAAEVGRQEVSISLLPPVFFAASRPDVSGPIFNVAFPAIYGKVAGVREGTVEDVDDVAIATDVTFLVPGYVWDDVEDSAVAVDTAFPDRYILVVDSANASEECSAGADVLHDVTDGALAGDTAFIRTDVLLEDGIFAGDEIATASTMLVVDSAFATQELLPQSDCFVLLQDGALVGDSALPYAFVDVLDGAEAGDDALIASDALVDDGAIADDELFAGSIGFDDLLVDGAFASDDLDYYSDSHAFIDDTAIADEVLIMKTPGLVAWVMNTDTAGVSWYDNWAFTSMASVGGKVFASGPDGLVVVGGSADGVEQIDAAVQYGFYELGGYDKSGQPKPSEQKKRVVSLWYGYHSDGVLNASVETYGQGYAPFTYAMQPREANQPRTNRIEPGRGLNARYWRIGVSNTDGCDFEVHSISAEVAASNRRI